MQSSFDFGTVELPAVAVVQEAGKWLAPQWCLAGAVTALVTARERIEAGIVGATRVLFELGLAAAEDELSRLLVLSDGYSEQRRAFHVSFHAPENEIERFIGLCDGSGDNFIETRHRVTIHRVVWVMFIEGAGTVTVSQWPDGRYGLTYRPWKSMEMQDSYTDSTAYFNVPSSVWDSACQAMNMAEGCGEPVHVSTVVVNGRHWVNTGQGGARGFNYCDAWGFVPAADWGDVAQTYRERVRLWDDGSAERGDLRGVKIKVNGQLAVLMDKAIFIDKIPSN